MSTHYAHAGQFIDHKFLGRDLSHVMTKVVETTNDMEIQVVNLKAGDASNRIAHGSLVAQCLTGEVELTSPDDTYRLIACQLQHLKANKLYSIRAISDSTVLIIMGFQSADPRNL